VLSGLGLIVAALLLAGALRAFVVQTFTVPTASMEPTLHAGQRVWVWRPAGLAHTVERGDLVVIDGRGSFIAAHRPDLPHQVAGWFGLGPRDVFYVKRVIGVAGDRVTCCSPDGRLKINGKAVDEPYVTLAQKASKQTFDVEVPAGRIWLMGDNRDDSTDSRALLGSPGGGMIDQRTVLGTLIGH
jgi:signal peptidase I